MHSAQALSSEAITSLNQALSVLPLLQLIMMHVLYFNYSVHILAPFFTGLALWIVWKVAPLQTLLGLHRLHPEDSSKRCAALARWCTAGTCTAICLRCPPTAV